QFRSSPHQFSSLPALTVTSVPSGTSPRAKTLNETGNVLFDRQCVGSGEQMMAGLPYPLWIAHYGPDNPNIPIDTWPDYHIWQFTSSGHVDGIEDQYLCQFLASIHSPANKVSFSNYNVKIEMSSGDHASGGNGEMDSDLYVSMGAAQDPASLKTKSTVWTLAPRRGAQVACWSSAKVQDVKWAMVDDIG
ncbi:hypothetical protein TYRP_015804, partial [Tyrophagus putrescentiae]